MLASGGIDAARPSAAITASDHVGAYDKVLVSVQRSSRTDELLPPAGLGVGGCAVGMTARRQAGVKQDGIALAWVQSAPRFPRDVVRGQHAAPIEEDGLIAVERLMFAAGVGRFGSRERALVGELARAIFGIVEAWEGQLLRCIVVVVYGSDRCSVTVTATGHYYCSSTPDT